MTHGAETVMMAASDCVYDMQCARCRKLYRAKQCGKCSCGGEGLRFVKTADVITPSVPINFGHHGCGSPACTVCARPAGIPCPSSITRDGYPSWWPTEPVPVDVPAPRQRLQEVTLADQLRLGISDEEWEREKLAAKLRLGEGRRWGPLPAGPSIASAGCGPRRPDTPSGCCDSCGDAGSGCHGSARSHRSRMPPSVFVAPLRQSYSGTATVADIMGEVDSFLMRNGLSA